MRENKIKIWFTNSFNRILEVTEMHPSMKIFLWNKPHVVLRLNKTYTVHTAHHTFCHSNCKWFSTHFANLPTAARMLIGHIIIFSIVNQVSFL